MGQETICTVQIGSDRFEAKALIETDHILIRGERRTKIPLSEMSDISADGESLQFTALGEPITLHLGNKSTKWAAKILNPASLMEKLGIKTGSVVGTTGDITTDFSNAIRAAGGNLSDQPGADLVFLFADSITGLVDVKVASFSSTHTALKFVIPMAKRNS